EAPAPEHRRQPSRGRDHDGVGGQERGDDPRHLVDAGRERALHVRQGHVGDSGVEHLHHRDHHHRERDGPLAGGAEGRVAHPQEDRAAKPSASSIHQTLLNGEAFGYPRARLMNEADTCRKFVVPKLQAAGWDSEPHSIAEQRTITDGRIVPVGKGFVRKPPKRVDYLLRYTRDFPLAVVEAKASYKAAADGVQQAKQYAEMLGLKFAYATNGHDVIEFDYFAGLETPRADYPTPDELWRRYRAAGRLSN